MKTLKLITGFVATFFVLMPFQLMAQEGGHFRFGNLKIVPGITAKAIQDDNIYMTKHNMVSDSIYHLMPGLLFNLTFPERGSLNLGYQGDFAFYKEFDKNNWKNHQGIVDLDYKAPGGLILGIANAYTRAEDPFGSDTQYKLGQVTKRWNDDLKSKLGFNFSNRFRSMLYFNFYEQDYDNDITDYSQDYKDYECGIGAEAKVLPKTWAFIRYYYGKRDYFTYSAADGVFDTNDSDFTFSRVNAGLTWDAAAKLSGELNFGYQWKSYDNALDPLGNKREDTNSWIASTSINFLPTSTTTLGLNIARALRDTGAGSNENYEDTTIGLTFRQSILTKFKFSLGASFSTNDYNLPVANPKKDKIYRGNIGLDYNIQEWLSAGIGYNYTRKDSNYTASKYDDNQYFASLKVVY